MPPFASYCLATFKRPTYLQSTLQSILQQTEVDYEIIVSDNDPEASALEVVAAIRDPRIQYHRNGVNVGMVRNFNNALAKATGSYVVMITDDDPIYPYHLHTLREAVRRHPDYGTYFAAGDIYNENDFVAACSNSRLGISRYTLDNQLRAYSGTEFLDTFFGNRIPFYTLWSCGMVRRDIAQATQMPDYGSPFLTDFAYIALTGSKAGTVLIHTPLGRQNVHTGNFGRKEIQELPVALNGFLSLFPQSDYPPQLQRKMIRFLTRWTAAHLWFLRRYFRNDPAMLRQVNACMETLPRSTPLTAVRRELLFCSMRQSLESLARWTKSRVTHSGAMS